MKGRFVVLPKNTRNHNYYEIPSDLEIAHRQDSKTATSSTLSLVHSMLPSLKEKGVDVLSFAIPPAHSTQPLIQTDTEEIGLRMSSVDSSPLETNSENEGISLADSKASLLFPSDHYFFGTDAEFQSLYKEFFFVCFLLNCVGWSVWIWMSWSQLFRTIRLMERTSFTTTIWVFWKFIQEPMEKKRNGKTKRCQTTDLFFIFGCFLIY